MGCGNSTDNKEEVKKTDFTKEFEIGDDRMAIAGTNLKEEKQDVVKRRLELGNTDKISNYYKVEKRIGSGAFSKVYKVTQIDSGQERAMKVVKRDTVNYQDDKKTFLKEIDILSQLRHPNIITIYEFFRDDINYYVITELAKGGELYDRIFTHSKFDEDSARQIMHQLLSAVFYFHSKNIVHRDLKPENILLDTNDDGDLDIKLIDFGTANYWNSKDDKLTLNIGTPYYIAPEILTKKYSNKCDLWSCGVIMYVLLCGVPPFIGKDEQDILKKVSAGKYSLASDEWKQVSDDAKELLKKLLTLNPEERYSAEQALQHPWIKLAKKKKSANQKNTFKKEDMGIFKNVRKFNQKEKFQEAVINYLVHHVNIHEMNKKLSRVFRELDDNGDGILSFEEIKKGFLEFFGNSPEVETEFIELMKLIDKDNSNAIEYEEFIRATIDLNLLLTDKNLKMAFKAFDKDGSEELSMKEIKEILGFQENVDNELLNTIVKEIDFDGNGCISFEEFRNIMKKVIQD